MCYEETLVESKARAAQEAGLGKPFIGNLTLYLTPLHILFLVCYAILCIDSFVYGVLSKAVRKKLKLVILRCLRDMKEGSKEKVFNFATSILVIPCTVCGLLGLLILPIYLLLLLPLVIPILAVYLLPFVNLSVRLVTHVFIYLCPSSVVCAARRLCESRLCERALSRLQLHIHLDKLITTETLEHRSSVRKWELPFQVLVVLVCLVSFWSVTFLMMELLSFAVEVGVYTFIGVIVTADVTGQYISIVFFLLFYGHSCFSSIRNKYLQYHQALLRQLVDMVRKKVETVALTEEEYQENTALHVQGDMARPNDKPPVTISVRDGRLHWSTSSILLFLDRRDTPYTPENFFKRTVDMNCCGCPGKLYVNILTALWNFLKIIIFLVLVFVVVMAFGSAYSVSSSNQLMATVAGGFIPFVFTRFFSKDNQDATLDPDNVQFKTQFHNAINSYEQIWPVCDIVPVQVVKQDAVETKVRGRPSSAGVPPDSIPTPHSTLTFSESPSSNNSDVEQSENRRGDSIDVIFDMSPRSWRGRFSDVEGKCPEGCELLQV